MKTVTRLASITAWMGGLFSIERSLRIPTTARSLMVVSSLYSICVRAVKSCRPKWILLATFVMKDSRSMLVDYWYSRAYWIVNLLKSCC